MQAAAVCLLLRSQLVILGCSEGSGWCDHVSSQMLGRTFQALLNVCTGAAMCLRRISPDVARTGVLSGQDFLDFCFFEKCTNSFNAAEKKTLKPKENEKMPKTSSHFNLTEHNKSRLSRMSDILHSSAICVWSFSSSSSSCHLRSNILEK